MKILLSTINSKYIHQNLAIRLLYQLNKKHENLELKEFHGKESTDEIADYCADFQLVAFSCYIWNITKTLEVAKKIKLLNPESKILLGGPEVTYEWHEIIQLNEIDYLILGEGEIPFASFLGNYGSFEKVPGLVWKNDGEVIENKNSQIFDLTTLEKINPYVNDSEEELKTKISYIESSRGCPHCCEFCLAGLQNKIRYLPIENIKSNLLFLMKNGKIIKFLDRTFNTNTNFAIAIFKFILENYSPGNLFQFEIKADTPQPGLVEFINLHVPKGVFRFEIGIQTLNSKSNEAIKRKQNFAITKNFIEQIKKRIEIHLDLIVGLPHDYWQDIKYSFEEVFKLFAPELQLGFLKLLKGTPLRNNYKAHGYQYNAEPPYQIIESNYLTKNEVQKIELIEQMLEIYWNKKRAINTLKYIALNYSIFDFLLELGKYFKTETGFKNYDLNEIYTNIYHFSDQYFTKNTVISELIAVDYYLHYKVKPKIRFLPEIPKSLKYKVLESMNLNHNKFRYIVHPIHFKLEKYLSDNMIEFSVELLIVQYDGVNRAQIIFDTSKLCSEKIS